jgi:hypothetical protein
LIHAPRVEPPSSNPELERELLDRFSARHDAEHRRSWWFALGWNRLAVAIAAVLLVIVGACVLPTSYDVPLGLSVEIITTADLPHAEIVELAQFVRERGEASEVEVIMRRSEHAGTQETQMLIRMWDQSLAVGELEHELREAFPELGDASVSTIIETPLEGEIETVWGRRIAHRAFHVALREADIEQARANLLAQMAAKGLAAEQFVVEFNDRPDGRREIKVEIEHTVSSDGPPPLPNY